MRSENFMKPNILISTDLNKNITTHPAIIKAVGKLLEEAGANVYYGNSQSLDKSETNLAKAGLR